MALRLAGEGYAEGGISDHGQLDGLGDDDHAQYLLANGTRNAAKVIITDSAGHYLQVPKLTTAERDGLTAVNGMLIYNTTTGQFERYQAGAWGAFGGVTDHGGLTGLGDDDHTQYLNTARHDVTGRHTLGTVVPHDDHGLLSGLGDDDHTQYVLRNILTTHGDLFSRGASAIERLGPGTSGQFLKTQGAGANPVWADVAGGGFDFFDKFRDIVCWVSLDGFTTTVDTGGSLTADGHPLYFKTGNVSGNKAYLYANCDIYRLVETGKKTIVEWVIYSFTITVANAVAYLHESQSLTAPPSETANHFGFKILNGDIFASNADGTTQKITDTLVDLAAGSQHTPLRVEVAQGVNAKFYVNGVLKVTHTENLPPAGQYRLNMGVTTNEAANKYMRIGRVAYERER